MSELLDVVDLARRYKRARRTIYRWIAEGKLPPATLIRGKGRNTRYWREDELLAWERENTG